MPNPFGLSFGETPNSQVAEYLVRFHAVPKPHPDMKEYAGTWQPGIGLTSIRASSSVFRDDPSGHSVKALYERLKKQLNSIYGPSKTVEFIEDDATWHEDDEFVNSLLREERCHFTQWSIEHGSKLDSNIDKIFLTIIPENDDCASVSLGYDFKHGGAVGPGEQVGLSSL